MKMIIDRASSRGYANHGWLDTKHTFSFANYYNPQRMHFGALRVLNDDTVAPGRGFDMHPHQHMEVISIPLKGFLRHGDSIENSEVITPGDIQVMSAGRGIYHSEYNGSDTEPLEFLQIWVFPRTQNLDPRYASYDIRHVLRKDNLSLIISPDGDAPAMIDQYAWFSMGRISAGLPIRYALHRDDTGVYVFVIEGEIKIQDEYFHRRDGVGIYDTQEFEIETVKDSHLLLIEVPMLM